MKKAFFALAFTMAVLCFVPAQAEISASLSGQTLALTPVEKDYVPPQVGSMAPERIKRFAFPFQGVERAWQVFVPSGYDEKKPLPLVIALHGYGNVSTEFGTWDFVAERENFVVVWPEAIRPVFWNIWENKKGEGVFDDMAFITEVINQVQKEYAIDTTRMYMHGQSMGDNMATTYVFKHGNIFAASAPASGPTLPSQLMDEKGQFRVAPQHALPMMRIHGENDFMAGFPSTYQTVTNDEWNAAISLEDRKVLRYMLDQIMKDFWIQKNECSPTPLLAIDEERNIEIYPGKIADFINIGVVGGKHSYNGDFADYAWDQFFSGYQRVDGKIVQNKPKRPLNPDKNAVALAADSGKAYVNNTLVSMGAGLKSVLVDDTFYMPVAALPVLFPGTRVEFGHNGQSATISSPKHVALVAKGRNAMLVDNHLKNAAKTLQLDNQLMVPCREVAQYVYDMSFSSTFGAAYMVDHPVKLIYDGACAIRIILGTMEKPKADLALEKETIKKIEAYAAANRKK